MNLSKLIDFLVKHQITFNQFMFCYILYLDKDKAKHSAKTGKLSPAANLYKYATKVAKFSTAEISDLVSKGFIIDRNVVKGDKQQTFPDLMEITDKFVNELFMGEDEFIEFWDTYPGLIPSFDGSPTMVNLKACNKEEIYKQYKNKVISKDQHHYVMEVLRESIQRGWITCNIEKYIASELWDTHSKELINLPANTFGTTILNP